MSIAQKIRDRAFRRLMRLPKPLLQRLAGPKITIDGSTLDPQIQLLLTLARLLAIRDSDDVAKSRRAMDQDMSAVAPARVAQKIERDLSVDGAAGKRGARLYVPTTASPKPPLLVFFHGGGFAVGSIASHDAAVRELARDSKCAVLSVDYRLAPESKAPSAPEDGLAAYLWARAQCGRPRHRRRAHRRRWRQRRRKSRGGALASVRGARTSRSRCSNFDLPRNGSHVRDGIASHVRDGLHARRSARAVVPRKIFER